MTSSNSNRRTARFYTQLSGVDYIVRCIDYTNLGIDEPLLHVGAEVIELTDSGKELFLGIINKECWQFATKLTVEDKNNGLFFNYIVEFMKSDKYLFTVGTELVA